MCCHFLSPNSFHQQPRAVPQHHLHGLFERAGYVAGFLFKTVFQDTEADWVNTFFQLAPRAVAGSGRGLDILLPQKMLFLCYYLLLSCQIIFMCIYFTISFKFSLKTSLLFMFERYFFLADVLLKQMNYSGRVWGEIWLFKLLNGAFLCS